MKMVDEQGTSLIERPLMLGDTCLDEFLPSRQIETMSEEIEGLKRRKIGLMDFIVRNKDDVSLPCEQVVLDEVCRKKEQIQGETKELKEYRDMSIKYQLLNPDFLGMRIESMGVTLPRFGVFPFWRGHQMILTYGEACMPIGDCHKRVPDILGKPLLRNLDLNRERRFITSFRGLIPKEVKERAKEAREDFNRGLYLISELKPEDWEMSTLTLDPLLVGIYSPGGKNKEKCYLIDKFDTTPLEEFIAREFTS